jgi:hypothetical protein
MKPIVTQAISLLLLVSCSLFTTDAFSQNKFRYSIPGLDSLEESFIVNGGATTVLSSGEVEVIWNNTLASYWIGLHENGPDSPIFDRIRQTQFISDLYAFYGVSASGSWDIGLNLRYMRARKDNAASSSMFRVFQSQQDKSFNASPDEASGASGIIFDDSFGGLVSAGLRFRVRPFRARPELVLNGGYSISTVRNETEQFQLGAGRDMIDVGATYYKELNPNTYYFFSGMFMAFLPTDVDEVRPVDFRAESLYSTNLSFFLIQRTNNNKFTFYPGLSYGLNFKPSQFSDRNLIRTQEFLFAYAGVQYAPNLQYNVFLTLGLPLIMEVESFQQSIVRESYSIISLGARAGF